MNLSDWIKSYRQEHGLSMQAFADLCGFSKAYVAILEKGINPSTNKPVSPTMQTLKKIADVTGKDLNDFLESLDKNQLVTLNARSPSASNTHTKKDRDDLSKFLDRTEIMFDGDTYHLDEEGQQKLRNALEFVFWDAKKQNKRKKD